MVRKGLLSVVLAAAFCAIGFAQNRPVSGIVSNQEGSPLVGAVVTVQGTTSSSITDNLGRYTINAPANGSLEFSSFGMESQVIPIESRSSMVGCGCEAGAGAESGLGQDRGNKKSGLLIRGPIWLLYGRRQDDSGDAAELQGADRR